MRVLLVSPVAVFPQNTGTRSRILSLSRQMQADGAEVHFGLLDIFPKEVVDDVAMRTEYGDRYHRLAGRARAFRQPAHMARRALRKLGIEPAFHFALDDWFDDAVLPELARLNESVRFDVVMTSYVFTSKALTAFPSARRIIDTHDSVSLRNARRAGYKRAGWYSTYPEEEVRGFRRADCVVAIQEGEAELFRTMLGAGGPPVTTVGHVPLAMGHATAAPKDSALFVGAGNSANFEALSYYVEKVSPIVMMRNPAFQLFVAGSMCQALPADAPVVKVGEFGHPADVFLRTPLLINPMRTGTGMNIKILEAIAHGVPVVSTRTGVRGLSDTFLSGVTVANDDDAEAFAEGILSLCRPDGAWETAAANVRAAAEKWNLTQTQALREVIDVPDARAKLAHDRRCDQPPASLEPDHRGRSAAKIGR